jgi:hypothetical protein
VETNKQDFKIMLENHLDIVAIVFTKLPYQISVDKVFPFLNVFFLKKKKKT